MAGAATSPRWKFEPENRTNVRPEAGPKGGPGAPASAAASAPGAATAGAPKTSGPEFVIVGPMADKDLLPALNKARSRNAHQADATSRWQAIVSKIPVPSFLSGALERLRERGFPIRVAVLAVLGLATGIAVSVVYVRASHKTAGAAAAPSPWTQGTVKIVSRPDGARVVVDGVLRGTAPLSLSLPVGAHTLEMDNGTARRTFPLTIEAGTAIQQYVDLAPGAVATTGRVEVTSDPPGAQVTVDGAPRGATPLSLDGIAPGQHKIGIANADQAVTRTVDVAAGATASVVASLAPVGAAAGWVSIKSPLELQVVEGGQVIGTTTTDRLMLPTGRHDLQLVSDAYEFQTTATIQIAAGKVATTTVALPNGSLSINAVPWADVLLDGKAVGTTPLGNLSVPIGTHDIVWRHPQLGEKRQTVKVTAKTPVRVSMDLSK